MFTTNQHQCWEIPMFTMWSVYTVFVSRQIRTAPPMAFRYQATWHITTTSQQSAKYGLKLPDLFGAGLASLQECQLTLSINNQFQQMGHDNSNPYCGKNYHSRISSCMYTLYYAIAIYHLNTHNFRTMCINLTNNILPYMYRNVQMRDLSSVIMVPADALVPYCARP